jgi:hypothetical protein
MDAVFCCAQFHPSSSVVVRLIFYPHIWPLYGRKPSTYKFCYAWSAMMHAKDTRIMFLKMEQRRNLEKPGVTLVQRNCCMGCLLPWWIQPLQCALDSLRIVYPWKAWMGCPQVYPFMAWMYCLLKRHGFIGARATAPFGIHLRHPLALVWPSVLEECF